MAPGKRLSREEFISRAIQIHNNVYDYSRVEYKNFTTKVEILCPTHGVFFQKAEYHLCGYGCSKCGLDKSAAKQRKSIVAFVNDSNKIHHYKYDYSKVEYKNWHTKVKILCPNHGEFLQSPNNHQSGHGCPKCVAEATSLQKSHTTDIFIAKAITVHGTRYDYSKTTYTKDADKVIIICPEHGEFFQVAGYHLSGHGCPACKSSNGEKLVRHFLKENRIPFEEQKRFASCRNQLPLPFDFYIPHLNMCIEYDGEGHYYHIPRHTNSRCSQEFDQTKANDQIKTEFCKVNDIKLIRIPYWEKKNIRSILKCQLGIE
jgi:hypothetical protein